MSFPGGHPRTGYPPLVRSGWGTPCPQPGQDGEPFSRDGVPPAKSGWATPHPRNRLHLDRLCRGRYSSSGFRREDFLAQHVCRRKLSFDRDLGLMNYISCLRRPFANQTKNPDIRKTRVCTKNAPQQPSGLARSSTGIVFGGGLKREIFNGYVPLPLFTFNTDQQPYFGKE